MKQTPDSPDSPESGDQQPQTDQEQGQTTMPRREFLRGAAIAAAGLTIVPRHVLGGTGFTAPSDTVNDEASMNV